MTLSEFLRLHGHEVVQLFAHVLQVLRRARVARLDKVSIDSTRLKVRALRDRVVRRTELGRKVKQRMEERQDAGVPPARIAERSR